MTKNYLLKVIENCSDEKFGQDAVGFAILTGAVTLTGDLETDLRAILGEPGKPETGRYDEFSEAWRHACHDREEAAMSVLTGSGLMEEILRPVSLAQTT